MLTLQRRQPPPKQRWVGCSLVDGGHHLRFLVSQRQAALGKAANSKVPALVCGIHACLRASPVSDWRHSVLAAAMLVGETSCLAHVHPPHLA